MYTEILAVLVLAIVVKLAARGNRQQQASSSDEQPVEVGISQGDLDAAIRRALVMGVEAGWFAANEGLEFRVRKGRVTFGVCAKGVFAQTHRLSTSGHVIPLHPEPASQQSLDETPVVAPADDTPQWVKDKTAAGWVLERQGDEWRVVSMPKQQTA